MRSSQPGAALLWRRPRLWSQPLREGPSDAAPPLLPDRRAAMTARLAEIAFIVLPIFALIGVGYVAGWTRHLGERAADGLSEYVFGLAVPVLIFKTLSEAKLPE